MSTLQVIPSRYRYDPDDPYLLLGNLTRERESKLQITLPPDDFESLLQARKRLLSLRCSAKSCNATFTSAKEMNAHYASMHCHQCSLCFTSFPCQRILSIHIEERHDSYFKARVQRGDSCFVCLVDGCAQTFTSDALRTRHLRRVHLFPGSFQFHKPHRKSLMKSQSKTKSKKHSPKPKNPDSHTEDITEQSSSSGGVMLMEADESTFDHHSMTQSTSPLFTASSSTSSTVSPLHPSESSNKNDRKHKTRCRFFNPRKGTGCKLGSTCPFLHPVYDNIPQRNKIDALTTSTTTPLSVSTLTVMNDVQNVMMSESEGMGAEGVDETEDCMITADEDGDGERDKPSGDRASYTNKNSHNSKGLSFGRRRRSEEREGGKVGEGGREGEWGGDDEMDVLTNVFEKSVKVSVPNNISFGRRGRRR